jgi:hypothetical protein
MMAACHLDTNAYSTLFLQGSFRAIVPRMLQVAQPVRPSHTTQAGLLTCLTATARNGGDRNLREAMCSTVNLSGIRV